MPGQVLSRPYSMIERPSMLPAEVPGKATALRRRAIARPRPAPLGPAPDPLRPKREMHQNKRKLRNAAKRSGAICKMS